MKYRNKLEEKVALMLPNALYEPYKISYKVEHTYLPDFLDGLMVYEVKGFFRGGDCQKYIAINEHFKKEGKVFKFLFQNPNKKVRKGCNLSLGDWANKHCIAWAKC